MESIMMFSRVPETEQLSASNNPKPGENPPADGGRNAGADVATKTRVQVKKPSLYRVLLLNDDYTTMDFVIYVLQRFFQKNHQEATKIMMTVHHTGMGECGVYTYEVAETKAAQVMDCARRNEHPLQCVIEKE